MRLPFSSDCQSLCTRLFRSPPGRKPFSSQRLPVHSDYQSPATTSPQRLPVSSDYQSPAATSLQRLEVSSASQSPAPRSLQRLPVSSASQSPAPPSLQRLPVSTSQSPAPPSLQRLPVSSDYQSPAPRSLQRLPATGAALLTLKLNDNYTYDSVNAVAFSPDDKQLASGSFDSTVRLWDPATGAALQTLRNIGYGNSVNAVAFSPDGKQLASGSLYGTVRLWDPATGAALQTLRNNDDSDSVNAVAFSPDGKQLASGSLYGTVRLWDSATGAALLTLTLKLIDNHTYASVSAVAFSPDGKQLASGSSDGTVRLWDPATGAALLTLTMPNNTEDGYGVSANAVNAVAYSPDGKQPASTTTTSAKPTSTNIEQPPQRDGSLSKGAKVGIEEKGQGVAPVKRSQERFEKAELHNSDLPRTHGRAELEACGPISELERTPAEGRKTLHKAEEVFEKGIATN